MPGSSLAEARQPRAPQALILEPAFAYDGVGKRAVFYYLLFEVLNSGVEILLTKTPLCPSGALF
jgi:hypothetical protein